MYSILSRSLAVSSMRWSWKSGFVFTNIIDLMKCSKFALVSRKTVLCFQIEQIMNVICNLNDLYFINQKKTDEMKKKQIFFFCLVCTHVEQIFWIFSIRRICSFLYFYLKNKFPPVNSQTLLSFNSNNSQIKIVQLSLELTLCLFKFNLFFPFH